MTQFVSLSSGSNGNCYYIGNETLGILIDAGIGTRTIKKRLSERGLSVDRIRCVLVSHDHYDHIRSLGTFAQRFSRPVYATAPCIASFSRHYCTRDFLNASHCRKLEAGISVDIDGVRVLPFSVPHDATDTVGFFIDFFGETFTFLTDVGDVTEDAVRLAARARHLIVEANYDPEMLRMGSYPPDLQARIRNGHGHLSNAQTAELILRALQLKAQDSSAGPSADTVSIQDVFLCHLSENNNTPELALSTISSILHSDPRFTADPRIATDPRIASLRITALPRREASEVFTW